jgi:hypothetical protein
MVGFPVIRSKQSLLGGTSAVYYTHNYSAPAAKSYDALLSSKRGSPFVPLNLERGAFFQTDRRQHKSAGANFLMY